MNTQRKWWWFTILSFAIWYTLALPQPLFDEPLSVVLEDRNGQLLGARIAEDGQWRFPLQDTIPKKFEEAIIAFEDRRFSKHLGVSFRGLLRAFYQNVKEGRTVSGGSTITMQVIRMAKDNPSRNLWNKLVEIILATRLELKYSKATILQYYASNAPFGGNVVGLEAASWRYFGKKPELLSWSEAATLAVLPNAPGLIHPGRNRAALLQKRNRLLRLLLKAEQIDSITYTLALEEPLPDQPLPLPQIAPHLLDRVVQDQKYKGQARFQSTLDANMQTRVNHILTQHQKQLSNNYIHNAATLVADVETGEILAYVGNVIGAGKEHGEMVDIIPAPRSTGSILKPLLYAAMLDEGRIAPQSLIPDIPTQMRGYRPENFSENYDGVVTAKRALVRSLNIPIVILLQRYGLEKFHYQLQKLGFSSINQPPSHYGLPLVLGGAETTLKDITSTYASMARTLLHFSAQNGQYRKDDFRDLHYLKQGKATSDNQLTIRPTHFKASTIWFTFDAMQEVERPTSEGEWQQFNSSRRIAWKTGTSFGFRDAWAVGVDARYAVGVWVGNADGEGRSGLVGVQAAAPILFDIFNQLPAATHWFNPPYDEMKQIPICKQSGYHPLPICEQDTVWLPKSVSNLGSCPYHQLLHLDQTEQWQVNSNCVATSTIQHKSWFVLPPVEEHYFKAKNPSYAIAPPFSPSCSNNLSDKPMQLIYPKSFTKIYVPVDLNGERSRIIFSAAHRDPTTSVYWHLDEEYIGTTQHFHELALHPSVGKHLLTLIDEKGNRLVQEFEVLGK